MLWDFLFGKPAQDDFEPITAGKTIRFGIHRLPESEATSHFLALGATGSGKTIIQRRMMQDVLPDIGTGVDKRALVYDAKGDALPLLASIAPKADVATLNPFDARGVAWDVQRDVREPRVALELTFTMMPRESESQPFFADAARHILYAVFLGFLLRGAEWIFADVLNALSNVQRLKHFLKGHPVTRPVVSKYFRDARVLDSIISTLATKLVGFEIIGAAWATAQRKVSLDDWVASETILVLGNSEISREAIDTANRAIFQRISQYVLALPESFSRRIFFFLDELSEAGRLHGLRSLLKKGRSKGASVSICLQSLSGLRDEKLYGIHGTEDLMAQIGNRFYGRIECPESAEMVSRVFGDQEIDQYTTSHTWGKESSTTRTQQIVVRRAVLPSEFMNVAPCTRRNGLTAFYRTREYGCVHGHIPGGELFDGDLVPPDEDVEEFEPRPMLAQLLNEWTAADEKRFGIERKPRQIRAPLQDQSHRHVPEVTEAVTDALEENTTPKRRPNLLDLDVKNLDNLFSEIHEP